MPDEIWVMCISAISDKIELIRMATERTIVFQEYLMSFDPEAAHGRGKIATTTDITKAKRFPSFQAVMEEWKTQSKTVPLRPDGKPNRPLTAFTIQPLAIHDAD